MATVSFTGVGSSPLGLPLRQFDADEYMTMARAGVFEGRRRVELIGGYIVDMSPAGPEHSYVVMQFPKLFASLMDRFGLWIQGTLRIDRRHVVDPDFMLLKPRELSYRRELPTPSDVALIVEVSASSLDRDLDVKLPLYAAYGIPEYWIADVEHEIVTVHREPKDGCYARIQQYAKSDMVSALAAPEVSFAVQRVFE